MDRWLILSQPLHFVACILAVVFLPPLLGPSDGDPVHQSVFGKETFIFDRDKGVFIRNGFTVGLLRNIRAVTAQVTDGGEQCPMFRLILELPRCETVTVVRTHDIPAAGEFRLSGNIFSDPNKRFAAYTPWLDYDEQNLVLFLPPEIVALREKILQYVGEPATR